MSWVKENTFLAGLLGVTAVGTLGIGYVISSNGSTLDDLKGQILDKQGELQRVEGNKTFPSEENKMALKENAIAYQKTLDELQTQLVKYAPAETASVSVADFQGLENAYVDKLRAMYADVRLPENCRFGFDEYANKMAPQRATKTLTYQLGALEALFTELSKAVPTEIYNVHRPLTKAEIGEQAAKPSRDPRQRRATRGKQAKSVYRSLTVEIGAKLKEEKLETFLETLANNTDYCYVVRSVRIKNENEVSPNQKELSFQKEESFSSEDGGGGLFFGAEFEDGGESSDTEDTDSVEETVPSERILQQILGQESLDVHMKIDVLMFDAKEEAVLPTLN